MIRKGCDEEINSKSKDIKPPTKGFWKKLSLH